MHQGLCAIRHHKEVKINIAKVFKTSPAGVGEGSSFAKGTGRVCLTSCPGQSEWMQDALRGMEYRIGYDTHHADHEVPIDALVTLLDYIRKDA